MTIEEVSEHYNIPMEVLKMYERWNLCEEVKKVIQAWKYDDIDLERLGRTEWNTRRLFMDTR